MDSTLNLNTLASSLPNSNLAQAETDLLNNFKGIDLILLIHPQPEADKESGFLLQRPLLASPPFIDPLDRPQNGLTMPATKPLARTFSP